MIGVLCVVIPSNASELYDQKIWHRSIPLRNILQTFFLLDHHQRFSYSSDRNLNEKTAAHPGARSSIHYHHGGLRVVPRVFLLGCPDWTAQRAVRPTAARRRCAQTDRVMTHGQDGESAAAAAAAVFTRLSCRDRRGPAAPLCGRRCCLPV